jgi:glycosyltransferase involved in cell wall biosynthesis
LRCPEAFEVIVVNDGSVVDYGPVIDRHSPHLPLRYHRLERNQGVAHARNLAIRVARGEYIAFIADDYTLPTDFLITVSHFFATHPDGSIVTHNIMSMNGGIGGFIQNVYMQLALMQFFPAEAVNDPVLRARDIPVARAAVFRRSVFDEVGPFDTTFRIGEDGEMTGRLAAHGIPIHFLINHHVRHHENKGLFGFLRQRCSYGRSLYHAAKHGYGTANYSGLRYTDIVRLVRKKLDEWKIYARRRHGFLGRYLLAYPGLVVFLLAFYWGLFAESRADRSAGVARHRVSTDLSLEPDKTKARVPSSSSRPGVG